MATSRATSAALAAASWTVLIVLTAATLPTRAGAGTVTLFEDPGCNVIAQSFSVVGICLDIGSSGGGLRFAPTGGVSAAFFASPGCANASLLGVLPGVASLLGGATGALGGTLGAVSRTIGGVTGTLDGDGSFLFCSGHNTLSFQSFKLLASSK